MKIFSIFISIVMAQQAWSAAPLERPPISAKRAPGEDWHDKVISRSRVAPGVGRPQVAPEERQYAVDVATLPEQADLTGITRLPDYKTLQDYFVKVRDHRFIQDPNENMLRRITWMYPDDGCFARASLINDQLESTGDTKLSKVYVFGNLEVQSPNAAYGSVGWWYHVAVSANDGKDDYILDPAIDPMRPLKLKEWLGRLGDPDVVMAVCNSDTYTPYSDCHSPNVTEKSTDLDDQIYFLPFEKNRLQLLGRDWQKELGETPPWLKPRKAKTKYKCN
jgi:hypothetical protein